MAGGHTNKLEDSRTTGLISASFLSKADGGKEKGKTLVQQKNQLFQDIEKKKPYLNIQETVI